VLASNISICRLHAPLIGDCTEIFYMIDEGNILSIQYKMDLRGLKYMRNVDGQKLIFIDFYIPTLTELLDSTENALQFLRT
jgi:hypothetical protein